jgi:hypothetical protein
MSLFVDGRYLSEFVEAAGASERTMFRALRHVSRDALNRDAISISVISQSRWR